MIASPDTTALLEAKRAEILARMEDQPDAAAKTLCQKVTDSLREIYPPPIQTFGPVFHKGRASVSVWPPFAFGAHAKIILRVGHKNLMEVYARRDDAEGAIAALDKLVKMGYTLSPSIINALDTWKPGRTLASKGLDDA